MLFAAFAGAYHMLQRKQSPAGQLAQGEHVPEVGYIIFIQSPFGGKDPPHHT